jgi:hypothetical protein
MSHKLFYRLVIPLLVMVLSLLPASTASALDSDVSLQAAPTADLFSASAVLSNNDVTWENPTITYTVDFNVHFVSISEVDYYFIFDNDLLDQGETLTITGDFPGAFGFTNPNLTPQSTRLVTSPCSVHPEICDAFMDGSSQGEITISQDNEDFDPSVRIAYMIIYVYGTASVDVSINIKPGSEINPINTNSKGMIPVAILSTADFDAPSMVDITSLTFGKTGSEASLAFCDGGSEDVNEDGLHDLVCHFYTQSTGFQIGDTEGILVGQTVDGIPIEGHDGVNILK